MHKLGLLLLALAFTDDDALWRALDAGDASALAGRDTAEIVKAIRRGRALENGKKGEYREEITDAFGRRTDVVFVVPESYERSKPAGVIILLHGLGGNSDQLKNGFQNFANANGFLVIAPTAQPEPESAKNEDAPVGGWAKSLPHWWSYRDGNFPFTALALARRRYAVDPNRVILSGYSMGGFGTWNIGLRYPDRFAALVPLAGGISRKEYLQKSDDQLRPIVGNASNLPIFFAHGDRDMTVPVSFARRTRDQLKEFGYAFEYREVPKGGHILDVRENSPIGKEISGWLRSKKRNPHPPRVRHHFVGDYCPQAYWVRVSKFADAAASVDARVKGQTIEFSSTGAGEVTLYLDETLVDLAKPVKVVRDGQTVFEGSVEPSIDVVVETWKAREDADLVYRAKVVVAVR